MDKKVMTIVAIVAVAIVAIAAVTVLVLNNQPSGKTINSVEDLNGARIAVETGTTGDEYVTGAYEHTKKATVIRYSTYPDAFEDLKRMRIDAIIMDRAPAQAYVASNSGTKILDDKLDSAIDNYGFIFKLGNTELQTKFNTALAELKADGKIAEIETYWSNHVKGDAEPYIKETGTGTLIKVATSPDFPPYDAMYGTKFTGIDMDIIRAICYKIDYRVEFKQFDFDSIITAVQSGAVDVGASGISYTAERALEVLYSDTYTTTEQVVVVRA